MGIQTNEDLRLYGPEDELEEETGALHAKSGVLILRFFCVIRTQVRFMVYLPELLRRQGCIL